MTFGGRGRSCRSRDRSHTCMNILACIISQGALKVTGIITTFFLPPLSLPLFRYIVVLFASWIETRNSDTVFGVPCL